MPPDYRDVLRETLNRGESPKLYLDTNVILDILRPQRRKESVELLNAVKERSWILMTSAFALLEALDVEQENRWILKRVRQGEGVDRLLRSRRERNLSERDLRAIERRWESFVAGHKDTLEWVYLDEYGWIQAISLSRTTNMSAGDCIHVATALITECDVLATSDEPLRRIAEDYIATALPGQLLAFIGSLPS